MFKHIYIEDSVREHPRTRQILARFSDATQIPCQRHTEIFNRKAQNFRLQKKQPALILAEKFKKHVLPTPPEYNIGARHNYYFSHMLNCLYDCRYCFLQGMYRSAHYVLYVNYEDFGEAIINTSHRHANEAVHFFSGYDCDSLALEPVTGFADYILPLFAKLPHSHLELRTKSTQIRCLLDKQPMENCIVAFSLSPQTIVGALEHKTPDLKKRLEAIKQLQSMGWKIGLRFDPLIYFDNFRECYEDLFVTVFKQINMDLLHSVSLGTFRLPKDYFRRISKLYPEEKLFASCIEESKGMHGYREDLRHELLQVTSESILKHIPTSKFFPCEELPV